MKEIDVKPDEPYENPMAFSTGQAVLIAILIVAIFTILFFAHK